MASPQSCRKPKLKACGSGLLTETAAWSRILTCASAAGCGYAEGPCKGWKASSYAEKTAAVSSFLSTSSCARWPWKWMKAMSNLCLNPDGETEIHRPLSRSHSTRPDRFLMSQPTRFLSHWSQPTAILTIIGFLLLVGVGQKTAVAQVDPHERDAEPKISLSAGAIIEILRREPGLPVEGKGLVVRKAHS